MLDERIIGQLKVTLQASIEKNEVAGGNLLVIHRGEEQFYHEDGLADREAGKPIRRDSLFRLYSMTKPITATAVMLLVECGELDLFEPVSKFLPGFKNQKVADGDRLVPVEREADVRDMLNMTAGLVYGGPHPAGRATEALLEEVDRRLYGDSPMSTLEFANRLGECPLFYQPGSSWSYGTSADVLGAIIEVVSGMRFGTFLRKELFEPLGMHDTGFWLPEEKRPRLAKTYANDDKGGLTLYEGNHLGVNHHMDRDPAFESGGAGLVSSIDDAAKFTMMLMNKGTLNGTRILRPRTVEYLTSCTLHPKQQKAFDGWHSLSGHSYGNLMRVLTDPSQAGVIGSPGEYGWDGWLGAYFCNCPSDDLTFLLMVQRKDAGTMPLTRKLRNLILSGL